MNTTSQDIARFIEKVELPSDVTDLNACWNWTGAKHSRERGYGKFKLGGKCMNAHKVSHILFNGEVKENEVVGHLCNNERCCNPHHLVAQSQSDNMMYAVICGRHNSCRR